VPSRTSSSRCPTSLVIRCWPVPVSLWWCSVRGVCSRGLCRPRAAEVRSPVTAAGNPGYPAILGLGLEAAGRGVILEQFADPARQTTVAADGSARIQFDGPPIGKVWLVQRYVLSMDPGGAGSTIRVYVGTVSLGGFRDGSVKGDLNIADGGTPLFVGGGSPVIFVWEGGTPGDAATAQLQYVLARIE